jgi:hypothetical protein
MNRLTYWSLIISFSAIGGLVVNVFSLSGSFSTGFMFFLILFYIPILAIIRMYGLGMAPIEMLQSFFNRKLTFKRLFGKNLEHTESSK